MTTIIELLQPAADCEIVLSKAISACANVGKEYSLKDRRKVSRIDDYLYTVCEDVLSSSRIRHDIWQLLSKF